MRADLNPWPDRLVGAAGVVFVTRFLASTFVGASDLGGPDFPAETVAGDLSGRIGSLRLAAGFVGVSAFAGYWFVAGLFQRISATCSSSAPWVVLAAGVAMVTMVMSTSTFSHAAVMV